MSGNFDFPPASADHANSSIDEASNLVRDARTHRTALRNRLDEVRRLRDHTTDSEERRRLRMQQSAVREEIRRRHAEGDADGPPPPAITLRMGNLRRRARSRLQNRAPASPPTWTGGDVQQAVDRLNEASSTLSTLLDQPIPRVGSPDMTTREYSGEAEMNRRRKRRKLESEGQSTGHMDGFSYGFRGQVVSRPLVMKLVSCDGGIHTDAARNGKEYWPENVLRNDKSVYCSDNNKCNIILKHMGETTFCLKKLVIKAPERGFTAPVQEGMVFVTMSLRDVHARTSQYQIREPSPLRNINEADDLSSYRIADPRRPLSRRRDSGANRTIPPPISNAMPRSEMPPLVYENGEPFEDIRPPPINNADTTPPQIPDPPHGDLGFNVTMTCDDPSSDEEEPSSDATMADLFRRERFPPPGASSDEDDEDGLEHAMRRAGRLVIPNNSSPSSYRRNRRRAEPSKIEVMPLTRVPSLTPEEVESMRDKLKPLVPHARFFIEREKSVVSIKFDPPV
ncbi:hypothetical protein ACLMJK_009188 [Lecanora helva]